MDTKNILKSNWTLGKLSAITAAVAFWDNQNVKTRIHEYINGNYLQDRLELQSRERWRKIIKFVVQLVNSLYFPHKLIEEIKCYIFPIGGLILDFIHHTNSKGFDAAFCANIYLRPYGNIDEIRMTREWLTRTGRLNGHFLSLANLYIDGNLIGPNLRDLTRKLESKMTKRQLQNTNEKHLYLFFSCFYMNNICFFAARYFWRNLNFLQKRDNLIKITRKVLYEYITSGYERQKRMELLIFFMNEMSDDQRSEFLSEKRPFILFQKLLKTWPYQELCLNIIDIIDNPTDLLELVDSVIRILKYPEFSVKLFTENRVSPNLKYYKNKNIYHVILDKLLNKIPKENKLKYFNKMLDDFVFLHQRLDYVTISIIANDVDLKELKHVIISKGAAVLRDLVLSGDFDELDEYMEHVLSNENERKSFKGKLCRVLDGEWIRGNDHLSWISGPESDAQVGLSPLFTFIQIKRYDLAERFLLWRFDTEEDRRGVKNCFFKSDEQLRDEVLEIWNSKTPPSRNDTCTALLTFFLESEEAVIEFRKTKLFETKSFTRNFKDYIRFYTRFDICHDFLKFCFRSPEEIKEIRNQLGKFISKKANEAWWD